MELKDIFTYCEQSETFFVAQPLNIFSNLFFFLAAYYLYHAFKTEQNTHKNIPWLIAITCLIGMGSVCWHYFETGWALMLDVVPIFSFLILFQITFLSQVLTMPRAIVVVHTGGLLIAMAIASQIMSDIFLQKSNSFIPVIMWLIYAAYLTKEKPTISKMCLFAATSFTLALILRIVDMPLCHVIPTGTHFGWHILSAATLYIAMWTLKGEQHET